MPLLRPAGDPSAFALCLRLVLVQLLLRPMGPPLVRALLVAVATAGLLSPGVLAAPLTWIALAGLLGARLVAEWPLPDNHIYLTAYFCGAIAIALLLPRGREALARSSRLLLGLAFAFAVLWKGVLSTDFTDGRYFRVTLLADARFEDATRLIGGLAKEQLRENRQYLAPRPEGALLTERLRLHEPDALRALARAATWGALALEAVVAIAFLWPGERVRLNRHLLLLAFCVGTLSLVAGFGWLLLAMGLATCRPEEIGWRRAYLVLFLLVLLFVEVPWAGLLLGG